MAYQRFRLRDLRAPAGATIVRLPTETVASVAKASAPEPQEAERSVASVATVASPTEIEKQDLKRTVANVASVASDLGPPLRMQADLKASPESSRSLATLATVATLSNAAVSAEAIADAYGRLLRLRGPQSEKAIRVAERFLANDWDEACRLGWSDLELFGCHHQPSFALVRYDCMGAVTLAVSSASPIASIAESEIRYENGTAVRRSRLLELAAPVWTVFGLG